ncbi:MAG TPA: TIGR00300 family protein, partial [Candidatus Eisenbacteria bacterium]|nr:TIGR00300 family protein [Candidatus Eisenbacteria bacterium]
MVSGDRYAALMLLEGHIIDSMMLPRLLDLVMDRGGSFDIQELRVGQHKIDTSACRIEVTACDAATLDDIVRRARELGARVVSEEPVRTERVGRQGVYPEGFYSTSNLSTEVMLDDRWVPVEKQEMDCAVAVDRSAGRAWCIPFYEAVPGL